jgi:hypothetical protein
VQFTADQALKDKLERARDLLRHANPSGDIAVIMDRALDLLLAEIEKTKFGKADHPKRARPAKPGSVTRAARREVAARDGERCAFVDAQGRRCPARAFLEVDHIQPKALGGSGTSENLRLLCAAHNRLEAEQCFGQEYIERQIHLRQSKLPSVSVLAEHPGAEAPDLGVPGTRDPVTGIRGRDSASGRNRASGVTDRVGAADAKTPV